MNPYRVLRLLVVTPLMVIAVVGALSLVLLVRSDFVEWKFWSWSLAIVVPLGLILLFAWLRDREDRWFREHGDRGSLFG
jgi:uncharacterized BrkB/YihY/UPF0761 family membrane protein